MDSGPDAAHRINSFALVAYLRGPLAHFTDSLREELVPGCASNAHVTVLPPRALVSGAAEAVDLITDRLKSFSAFHIEAISIQVFPITDVIFAEVGEGSDELMDMHRELNTGALEFDEPFEFHPQLTLAQGLRPEQVPELLELADRRWHDYKRRYSSRFLVENLTFVQSTVGNRWIDLCGWDLDPRPAVYSR
jgi:2'-5' RNA ligase